jgi:hypothetical protein
MRIPDHRRLGVLDRGPQLRVPRHAAAVVADQDRGGPLEHGHVAAQASACGSAAGRRGPAAAERASGAQPHLLRGGAGQRQRVHLDSGRGEQFGQPGSAGVVGERGDQRDVVP